MFCVVVGTGCCGSLVESFEGVFPSVSFCTSILSAEEEVTADPVVEKTGKEGCDARSIALDAE